LQSHHEMKNNHTAIWMLMTLAVCIVCVDSTSANQLLISSHNISMAYGQQESQSLGASTPFLEWYEKQKDSLQASNPLSVKILSPAKEEHVPAGRGLIVSGTSTDNTTSDCKVSVIVNAVKPYQQTVANGTGGIDDYSTWNFIVTPEYTSIKEGPDNKITSKLECTPNLTKWYSVNVTGISTTTNANRAGTEMQTPPFFPPSSIISKSNITNNIPLTSESSGSSPIISDTADPVGQTSNSSLLIYVNLASNSVAIGDAQTIEVRVLDPISLSQINDAIIELEVTDPSGTTMEEFSDDDGDISSTVVIGSEDEEEGENTVSAMPGTFTVTLRASAVGYEPEITKTTFDLVEQDVEDDEVIDDEDSESVGNGSNELFDFSLFE
jgi:hypothetical protein